MMVTSTEASSASRFWTAIVAGDPAAAAAAGDSLVHLPFVTTPSFEFPESSVLGAIGVAAAASAAAAGESPVLPPLTVHPDTPQATLSAWNANTRVHLMVVQKTVVCGARVVSEGKEDFIACASASCETFSHRGKKPEYYVDLPLSDVKVFVVRVRASTQTALPRIFSKPMLPFTSFPVEFRDEKRLGILLGLKLYARVWKFLLKAHLGYDWMSDLAYDRTDPMLSGQPPMVSIPSPRVGEGVSSLRL